MGRAGAGEPAGPLLPASGALPEPHGQVRGTGGDGGPGRAMGRWMVPWVPRAPGGCPWRRATPARARVKGTGGDPSGSGEMSSFKCHSGFCPPASRSGGCGFKT